MSIPTGRSVVLRRNPQQCPRVFSQLPPCAPSNCSYEPRASASGCTVVTTLRSLTVAARSACSPMNCFSRLHGSRTNASLLLRPNHALILLRHRRHSLIQKLLNALPAIRLRSENVALRIGRDAVHGVEFAGLPAAVAEAGQDLHRVALDDVDLLVGAVGQVDVRLLRIFGERDVPRGAVAERVLRDEDFLDESAIGFEDLDAIVGTVANVEQAVVRQLGAMH